MYVSTVVILLVFLINLNKTDGCECPQKDNRNYVRADAGDVQTNGQLKCYYVVNAGDARTNLYCLYQTSCTIATDGDSTFCPSQAPAATTTSAAPLPGGGTTTTTTTTTTATTSQCTCPTADSKGAPLLGSTITNGVLACGYNISDNGCSYNATSCALLLDQHGGYCVGTQTNTVSASTTTMDGTTSTTTMDGTTSTTTMGGTTSTTMMGGTTSTTTMSTTVSTTTMGVTTSTTAMNVTTSNTTVPAQITLTSTRSNGRTLNKFQASIYIFISSIIILFTSMSP